MRNNACQTDCWKAVPADKSKGKSKASAKKKVKKQKAAAVKPAA